MSASRHECSICMDSFKNPKLISCHHSFCYKCLEDYVQVNLHNGCFNCPICRTSVHLPESGISGFTTNFYIDTDSNEKFPCEICGPKNVASSRCLDCEENLCQSCCYVHEKLKVSRHHKIIDLVTLDPEMKGKIQQRVFCDLHPEEEIKLVCQDCKVPICLMCKAVEHDTHPTKSLADVVATVKMTLDTQLNQCSDKLRRIKASIVKGEKLDRSINDVEQEELKAFDDQCSQLHQAIDHEATKFKDKLKNVYRLLKEQNAVFRSYMEEEFKSCSNTKDIAQNLRDQGTDIEIIKKGPDIEQLISAAIVKTDPTPTIRVNSKRFSPAQIITSELIPLIGILQDSTDASHGISHRARGMGGQGRTISPVKHSSPLMKEDIELHHAKEPWKPKCLAGMSDEELFKKVRAILNKLTPQKFQTLVAKMQALEIDTEARLKSVIDLVFEKAISEPGFSVAYANMCRCLSMFKVPAESKQGDVNFRALLLTRCQREFEKANSSEKEFDLMRKEIEKATAEEQKQQMKEELEAEETIAKRRSLGNIRFIGELFKLKMLTENIMHDCVYKLLRTKDEENLECVCILLKTIGKELDTDKAKPRMDQYFAQMQTIVKEKKLSSRVHIMLQDMIEFRQGKWVPRRDDNNPKTIDQIRREVAQEAQDRAIFVQTLPQAKPQKGSHGRPGQPSGPMGGGRDGWNTVSRTPLRTDRTIDPTKLKLSKVGDSKNIQLGLVGGAACLGWFKGSTGGGARFQEGERPNAPGNRTIVAQRPSEERSSGREPESAKTMEKPSIPVQGLTDDQILNQTSAIMDEYLHIQDIGEAISRVQELSSSGKLHLFVYNALNQVLERSEVARRQTGLLLHDLVKNNVLLVDTYVKGLNEILMFAEDMEIDIPKIWEYLGQLIGPMVQDGSVPLVLLKQVCEPLKANGKSGILVAEILHDASHREGHKKVGKLWAESRLHWSDFVPQNQIDQFLSEKKLEFTKGGNSAPTSPTASMAIPKIEERLNDLITKRGCSNEEVSDWIEEEVDELTVKQEYFIRALMTAVCNSAVVVSSNNLMKVDKSQIQRRNNLLQRYLDHQANFELQALFALQALVHKLEHPPGVLRELFDILYDEDIISEDAFIQWEKSEDPQEQEGKGVAMKQVVQFFKWLKETEDDGEGLG